MSVQAEPLAVARQHLLAAIEELPPADQANREYEVSLISACALTSIAWQLDQIRKALEPPGVAPSRRR